MEHKWDKAGYSNYAQTAIWGRRLLKKYLAPRITKDDAIIDIGCGKGSMVYWFSQFPFRLVAGLDYSQGLIDIAEKNLAVLRKKRKRGGVT